MRSEFNRHGVTVEIAQQIAGHKVHRQPGFTICLIPDKPRFSLVFYALGLSTLSASGSSWIASLPRPSAIPRAKLSVPRTSRVYPENVVFEWPPVIGPDSGGVSCAHPWKSKMTITGHAVTIRRPLLRLIEFSVCRRQVALESYRRQSFYRRCCDLKFSRSAICRLFSQIGIFEYLSRSKENIRGRADHGSWVS